MLIISVIQHSWKVKNLKNSNSVQGHNPLTLPLSEKGYKGILWQYISSPIKSCLTDIYSLSKTKVVQVKTHLAAVHLSVHRIAFQEWKVDPGQPLPCCSRPFPLFSLWRYVKMSFQLPTLSDTEIRKTMGISLQYFFLQKGCPHLLKLCRSAESSWCPTGLSCCLNHVTSCF